MSELYITTPNLLKEETFLTFQILPGLLLQLLIMCYTSCCFQPVTISSLMEWLRLEEENKLEIIILLSWQVKGMRTCLRHLLFFSPSAVLFIFYSLPPIGAVEEEAWENSLNFFPNQKLKDM